jgi:hypothetical protein
MIPQFRVNGYLPPGIHKATLREFEKRFCEQTAERRELFVKFGNLLSLLEKHKNMILHIIIDGSFVTLKPNPGDMDIILILAKDFDFESPEALRLQRAKAVFNIHLVPLLEEMQSEIRSWTDFFGHDRERRPRGLVEVII